MRILHAILTHQSAPQVDRMAAFWTREIPPEDLLILYGGERTDFAQIAFPRRVYVEDPRLRTRRHREQRQSYTEVFRHIAERSAGFTHVLFLEYDFLPLVPIPVLHQAYAEALRNEEADVIFRRLHEVQGTSQEMAVDCSGDETFLAFWRAHSRRNDSSVVLWALLPGSFWTAEAVAAVAAVEETHPIYFEIYLPTLAHHLGFRLRPLSDERFVIYGGRPLDRRVAALRRAGALVAHPVKEQWNEDDGVGIS